MNGIEKTEKVKMHVDTSLTQQYTSSYSYTLTAAALLNLVYSAGMLPIMLPTDGLVKLFNNNGRVVKLVNTLEDQNQTEFMSSKFESSASESPVTMPIHVKHLRNAGSKPASATISPQMLPKMLPNLLMGGVGK